MRIVVFGSTGQTGRLVVQQALAAGHAVTAFARDPTRVPLTHDRLSVVRGDVLSAGSVEGAVQGQQGVLSTLGVPSRRTSPVLSQGTRHILDAMESHDVPRIVVMSAAGAMHEDAGFLVGNIVLGLGRRMLRGVYLEHGRMLAEVVRRELDWTVVRPMLLTNGSRTGRYRIALEGVPRGGLRISRADVADFMVKLLATNEYLRQLPAIVY